jgi:hypothetical protein
VEHVSEAKRKKKNNIRKSEAKIGKRPTFLPKKIHFSSFSSSWFYFLVSVMGGERGMVHKHIKGKIPEKLNFQPNYIFDKKSRRKQQEKMNNFIMMTMIVLILKHKQNPLSLLRLS